MNTIVDLLRYRNDLINQLGSLTANLDITEPLASLYNLNTMHSNVSFSVDHISNSFLNLQKEVQEKNISIVDDVKKLIRDVEELIDTTGQNLGYIDDVNVLGQNLVSDVNSGRYTVVKNINSIPPDFIVNKIKLYCNWRYPGLLISPMNKSWIDTMVSCDPLYLLNMEYNSYLETITSGYTIEYQRRLRLYTNLHDQNFSQLPTNQFGFILAWEILTEMSLGSIEKYLALIINFLRPGGIFETVGYKIIKFGEHTSENVDDICNWVEISKPGDLASVKRSQAIGSISSK